MTSLMADTVKRLTGEIYSNRRISEGNVKAIILAGGLGTRLSEETAVRPKPMAEIGGRLKRVLGHVCISKYRKGCSGRYSSRCRKPHSSDVGDGCGAARNYQLVLLP
jgi:hypothetical protein